MKPSNPPPSGPPGSQPWARAFTVVAVVAIVVLTGLYVFRSLRDLPGDAVDKTQQLLADLGELAAAFRRGTVETTFISYAASVSGSNYLQFATLRQTEVFTRQDSASILWGQLELPDVVVSATAPVEYTAYLDLDDEWRFRLEERTLWVVAPTIRFNKPAIDASEIRYEVRAASLLRNETVALQKLKEGLTEMSRQRAREHVPLIREMGRRKTAEFVQKWLAGAYADGADYRVEVVFADEEPAAGADRPRL